MRNIGIATVYTGYNYGSSLQAYALKTYLNDMGYTAELLGHQNSLSKSRDIRLKKLFAMTLRSLLYPKLIKKNFSTYKTSINKELSETSKQSFVDFQENQLKVKRLSWKEKKQFAKQKDTLACVCGSDQIWNATSIYLDPFYYLRFVPKHKRVAYAPSFGKDSIPKFNIKKIKKYVSEINYISIREDQGAVILLDLIQKQVPVLLDPTLLLPPEKWFPLTEYMPIDEYILLYFLDSPSQSAIKYIQKLDKKLIAIPYKYDEFEKFDVSYSEAGPIDFVNLVKKATLVLTDSFHGTAFAINFNIPFYTFERDYGVASNQSSRITSLLKKMNLSQRFVQSTNQEEFDLNQPIDFTNANNSLIKEREKSRKYLEEAFNSIDVVKND